MILSGLSIKDEFANGRIEIEPFRSENVTTNSYDLTLGNTFLRYTAEVLDPRKENAYETFNVGEEGLLLQKGDSY